MTPKSSKVWKYFKQCSEDASNAKCILCNTAISRGGIGRKATTSPLINHIKYKHKEYYNDVTQRKENGITASSSSSLQSIKNNTKSFKTRLFESSGRLKQRPSYDDVNELIDRLMKLDYLQEAGGNHMDEIINILEELEELGVIKFNK